MSYAADPGCHLCVALTGGAGSCPADRAEGPRAGSLVAVLWEAEAETEAEGGLGLIPVSGVGAKDEEMETS